MIPCGKCVIVDTSDGSTTSLSDGLNIEVILYFPSAASSTIDTTHIVVQGVLKMDSPDSSLNNKVRIRMTGSEDHYLYPHNDNVMSCDTMTGCKLGKKVIAVAGGRLNIRGLEDDTYPS